MPVALPAGAAYFAIVFAIGFVLGTIRVMFIVPRFGEANAVLIELPVMLALSWISCAAIVRNFAVPPALVARLVVGAAAFALLMLAELGVSVFGFGRTVAEHVAAYEAASAQLGLAGQIAFALFPVAQALTRRATD